MARAARRQAHRDALEGGLAALRAGRSAEAAFLLARAVEAAPRDAAARAALARARAGNGEPAEAIDEASRALGLDPKRREAARLLSGLLLEYELTDLSGLDPRGLRAAFAFPDVDHTPLARTALAWLKARAPLAGLLEKGASEGWAASADTLLSGREGPVDEPLFLAALAAAPLADPELEFLLSAARPRLLLRSGHGPLDKRATRFACALVRQSLANEFVWPVPAEEAEALRQIPLDAGAALAGDPDACRALLLHALYAPSEALLGRAAPDALGAIRPRELQEILRERLAALAEEAALGAAIPSLVADGEANAVSRAVAAQYENNPYPRWTSALLPEPGALRAPMRAHFTEAELAFLDRPFALLVAGCGTGQQLAHAARGYGARARVTAVDLSRASLGYAARMTRQLGLDDIAFRQGDILALDGTEEAWDLIESVGVLHHMAEPLRGAAILARALKPGGLLYLGLYSAAARRDIHILRDRLRAEGIGDSADEIRAVRRRMIESPRDDLERSLAASADFHTLSNVRDLLFHRHEAPLTLAEIRGFLAEAGLEFRGFDLRPHLAEGFRTRFGAGADLRDLDLWEAYESENPATFDGMFLFWCRRPGRNLNG